ncbi:hypothetical protein MMC07_003620 [Pseudocyphellaria aurata]|nr:hypothetical protein [Pseudocyphellaria aurata]
MEDSKRKPKLPIMQIIILVICRVAEPIALTSVFPYLPEMIESFNVPKNSVAKWAGITVAAFSLSQAATGILWGGASDRWGRKTTILISVTGAIFSSLLFGFSNSLAMAIIARSLTGATNGNAGTYRTVVAEMVPEKELQPRAFSIMPLVFAGGSIIGPGLGGALANPAANFPGTFGNSAFFKSYPYALPNIATSVLYAIGLTIGALFLKETLESKKDNPDYGRALGRSLVRAFARVKSKVMRYRDGESKPLLEDSQSLPSTGRRDGAAQSHPEIERALRPTYREVLTYQTSMNLLTFTFLATHDIAFEQLLTVFMHYPRLENGISNPNVHLPLKFSGGFGINLFRGFDLTSALHQADRIGLLFTLYGICGMVSQFFVFPTVVGLFGLLPTLKFTGILFPICYFLTPFTALFPTPLTQQFAIFLILAVHNGAALVAFAGSTIMLTNSANSLRVLGTLNGIATSASAIGKAVGPVLEGYLFSFGLDIGYVILPWWTLATIAALGAIPMWYLVELKDTPANQDMDPANRDSMTVAEPRPGTIESPGQTRTIVDQQQQLSE